MENSSFVVYFTLDQTEVFFWLTLYLILSLIWVQAGSILLSLGSFLNSETCRLRGRKFSGSKRIGLPRTVDSCEKYLKRDWYYSTHCFASVSLTTYHQKEISCKVYQLWEQKFWRALLNQPFREDGTQWAGLQSLKKTEGVSQEQRDKKNTTQTIWCHNFAELPFSLPHIFPDSDTFMILELEKASRTVSCSPLHF